MKFLRSSFDSNLIFIKFMKMKLAIHVCIQIQLKKDLTKVGSGSLKKYQNDCHFNFIASVEKILLQLPIFFHGCLVFCSDAECRMMTMMMVMNVL